MTTTTSYSKPNQSKSRFFSLYKASVKAQIPIGIVIIIAFFLLILLPIIINLDYSSGYNDYRWVLEYGIYLSESHDIFNHVLAGIVALVLALFANFYMHQKRMVDLYHSIPITRGQLLTANMLASMTTLFVPFFSCYIVAAVIKLFFNSNSQGIAPFLNYISQDIPSVILYALTIYLFVTFICVNVGTVFDSFAISCALGVSVLFIYVICGLLWESLSYGANFNSSGYLMLLCPFSAIFYRYEFIMMDANNFTCFSLGYTFLFLLIYALFVAALYFIAVFCYKRRRSERAEQSQPNGLFQNLVKLVASFAGGAMFYYIYEDHSIIARIIAVIVGAVIIGTIAELILSRGVRHYLKNVKWLLGTGVAGAVLIIIFGFDLTGFVTRVPAVDNISNVAINYRGVSDELVSYRNYRGSSYILTDPECIEIVTDTHKKITENAPQPNSSGNNYENYGYYYGFELVYTLKNGTTLSRWYPRTYRDAYVNLINLENKENFLTNVNPLFSENFLDVVNSVTLWDQLSISSTNLFLTKDQINSLVQAICSDMLDRSIDEIANPTSKDIGFIMFSLSTDDLPNIGYSPTIYIPIDGGFEQTISVMKQLNIYDRISSVPEPDSAYLMETYIDNEDQITVLLPSDYNEDYYSSIYAYMRNDDSSYNFAVTTDPDEVGDLWENAHNQLLVQYSSSDNNIYRVVFAKDNQVIGQKYIQKKNVPDSLWEVYASGKRG